jgi:hypothetical protein
MQNFIELGALERQYKVSLLILSLFLQPSLPPDRLYFFFAYFLCDKTKESKNIQFKQTK